MSVAAGASTSVRRGAGGLTGSGIPLALPLSLVPVAAALGWVLASSPGLYRPLFALGIASVLGLVALRWPNAAILAALLFLPFLGVIRRLLIESTGWPDGDPLLLIGPAVAMTLFVKAYLLESRRLTPDLLSKLVLTLLALVLLGIFNPSSAGLASGAAAALLMGIPLIWFFIGRAFPDRITIARVQYATAFVAGIIAVYGLYQTEVGFPAWDREWIDVGGYTSLSVGEQIRGWGTLAGASEYAFFLGAGFVFAVGALLHQRAWPIVLLPLLAVGITYSSIRATMILGILAVAVMLGMRTSRPRIVLPAIAIVGTCAYLAAAPLLANVASGSSSSLISHQVAGIARPFDSESSTLTIHLNLIANGITEGVQHPVGQGVALAPLASGEFSQVASGSEFDFSDMFLKFGVVGGILFLVLTGMALVLSGRHYLKTRDPLYLGTLGLGILTLGYWLQGGQYALAPLLWLMLGWATRPPDSGDQSAATDQSRG